MATSVRSAGNRVPRPVASVSNRYVGTIIAVREQIKIRFQRSRQKAASQSQRLIERSQPKSKI